MAHLVLGWELGHGIGQIMSLRMLAESLLSRGHSLTFIVRDTHTAQEALADLPVHWLQAPQVRYQPWELSRTDCYSQLLGNIGFRDPVKLAASVGGWVDLLDPLRADAAILEFAPSAMLACHLLGVPFALHGNGFSCPPPVHEGFGIMQTKMPPSERLAEDQALLDSINLVLGQYDRAPLEHIGALYAQARHSVLTTFRELDHFQREEDVYFSGIWAPEQTQRAQWPEGKGPRVFACLNAMPGVDRVLKILASGTAPTLITCTGLSAEHRKPFQSANCHFLDGPVDLRAIAREADLGIFHGDHSSTALFLLAGRPTLQLPLYMEQLLFARRIKALKAGELATLDQPQRIIQLLNGLLTAPQYRQHAQAFADRYQDFDLNREILVATDALENALL